MLHSSRIFIGLMMLYLTSVAIGLLVGIPSYSYIYIWPPLIMALFFWPKRWLRYIMLAVFVVFFALIQTGEPNLGSEAVDSSNRNFVIISEPKVSNYSQSVLAGGLGGERVMLYGPIFPLYQVGESINVEGKLMPAIEDPYYQENKGYFLVRGVNLVGKNVTITKIGSEKVSRYYQVRQSLVLVRKKYERILRNILPEPYSGLAIGIFLGTKSEIPDNINNLFITLGIVHIMALSGYNITVIADSLRKVSRKISVNFAFYFALSGIWLFVVATGLSASVVRAAIMGSLLLLARKLGRQADAFIAILLAATIMVAINPYILIYDVGFQLSFAAMCGLIFLAPLIEGVFRPLGSPFDEILSATIAAQIFTFPIICYYFGRVSLVSVLANLLIMPIIPLCMILAFVIGSVGLASVWLAEKLGVLLWIVLGYILKTAETLGQVPGVERSYKMGPVTLVACYILIIELLVLVSRSRKADVEKN